MQTSAARQRVELLRRQFDAAPIRTTVLVLRLPRGSDARLVFDGYAQDVEAIRWMGFRPHPSVTITEAVVATWVANWKTGAGNLIFVMEAAADGRFVGVIDIDISGHRGLMGYVLCRPAWGKGYATDAARVVVNLGFTQLGLRRVWATCARQNPASRRVLEKVGMRREGVHRRRIVSPLFSPTPRDSDCFAITRDDWLRIQRDHGQARRESSAPAVDARAI